MAAPPRIASDHSNLTALLPLHQLQIGQSKCKRAMRAHVNQLRPSCMLLPTGAQSWPMEGWRSVSAGLKSLLQLIHLRLRTHWKVRPR